MWCTVKLRHNDKIARFRFLVVPGDSPALLGLPAIKLLNILKIKCDKVEGQQAHWKFVSLTMESSSTLRCKVNIDYESRSDYVKSLILIPNMPDYFRFSMDTEADKGESQLITPTSSQ